jgi:hypothetical protein
MNRRLVQLHAAAAWLFLASIVVQVFLAGAAISQLGGSGTFASHVDFGYTWVGLAALAVVVTAIIARAGRPSILISLGLLALYIVQTILPAARASIPAVAALHPVNALMLFALAIWYARRASRTASMAGGMRPWT